MSSYTFVDTYEVEGLENKILELKPINNSSHISYASLLYIIYNNEYYYCIRLGHYAKITDLTLHEITEVYNDTTKVYSHIIHVKSNGYYYALTHVISISKELADKYETYCGNNEYILK